MTERKVRIATLSVVGVTLAAAMLALESSGTRADVPDPVVEGPIPYSVGTYGFPFSSVPDLADLAALGTRSRNSSSLELC